MNGLRFRVEQRTNAEEMSPSGKVPFIQVGVYLVAEMDPIVAFVGNKGYSLSKDLSSTQRAELRAYMAMVEGTLGQAEMYMAWVNKDIANEVTKPRYGCSQPWPLRWLLPYGKQHEITQRLKATDWLSKTTDEVTAE